MLRQPPNSSSLPIIIYASPLLDGNLACPHHVSMKFTHFENQSLHWLSFFPKRHDATDGACTQEAKYVPTHVGSLFLSYDFFATCCHTSCACASASKSQSPATLQTHPHKGLSRGGHIPPNLTNMPCSQ